MVPHCPRCLHAVAHKRLVSKDSGFVGFQETVHGCIASYSTFAAAVLAGDADTM